MDDAEMPRYKCHKTVHALKILAVTFDRPPIEGEPRGGVELKVEEPFAPIKKDEQWAQKHRPVPGGYYVLYADGYASFSPAEAFESGYTKVG